MKREERKRKDNIEKLEKVIEENKVLPKDIKEKINAKIFENIVIAVIAMIYLASLSFGMNNIPTDIYLMDLRVFSIMFLIIAIIVFEFGYKKDDGAIWIHGVEVMIIAIFTLYLIYLYSIYYTNYGILIFSTAIIYLIYYAIKVILIQRKIEKEYNKSLVDIRNIVKK